MRPNLPSNMHEAADCLMGHSFGTSTHETSVNAQLGRFMLAIANGRPMIADRTLVDAIPESEESMAFIVEGDVTNLKAQGVGTWGVLLAAREYMDAEGLRAPIMVAQAYHLPRVVKQAAKLGMQSIVPKGLPTDFDPDSAQIWTRSKYLWLPFNTLGSLLLKHRGQL